MARHRIFRASAIAYLREHQNSKCVPPVLIQFPGFQEELCDNKTDTKSYFLTSGDPQTCPRGKILHYYILFFITFDLICYMTMFVQNGFWTLRGHTPPTPRACSQGLHPNSDCVAQALIHRVIACESLEVLA